MIDCDVHQNFDSIQELCPFMEESYRDQILHGGYAGVDFPQYPWFHPEGFLRRDALPPDGGVPGSDYETMRRQLLDLYDIEYAILTGEEILTVSAMPSPYLAAAICRGYNNWLIETWLTRDPRFKGSIVVATQDPGAAAKEIRRTGGHPDVVQVLLPSGSKVGYGHPQFDPMWDAASELGLVVGIHAGGDGCGVNGQPTPTGWPTFYLEYHTLISTSMMSHLTSMICHGVFERFPKLRVVFIEGGVCWLPGLLWRLDQDYKALRMEVPWLKRLPSEYMADHVRLTTQPLERPARTADLRALLETIGTDLLLFATDYPHWDFDNPTFFPLGSDVKQAVFTDNARSWYSLDPRQASTTGGAVAGHA